MSDTTSILDLPTDPIGGNMNNNIVMKAQENPQNQANIPPQTPGGQSAGMSLDQTTINQIVNGLQQAKLTGATQLPSRDIPMNTTALSNDPQVVPNYVPPPEKHHTDYIKDYEQNEGIYSKYNSHQRQMNNRSNSLDDVYNEIQTPLLIGVLYFLFQLPFFKKFLYSKLSFLFSGDGNYNLNGYFFISILFGMVFHFLMKTTKYFGTF
jgi:hypothetical protein